MFHNETIHNVYELPLTEQVIQFLHAVLGFPTKCKLLAAIKNDHLTTFLGLTTSNVNRFCPESDEMQKGPIKQQQEGT